MRSPTSGPKPSVCARHGRAPLHLDLLADDRRAEVERLVELGATEVGTVDDDPSGVVWTVVRDPDGNEVCISE